MYKFNPFTNLLRVPMNVMNVIRVKIANLKVEKKLKNLIFVALCNARDGAHVPIFGIKKAKQKNSIYQSNGITRTIYHFHMWRPGTIRGIHCRFH